MSILYISPQFPKIRHGFELEELRELQRQDSVRLLSLRRPRTEDWTWMAESWPEFDRENVKFVSASWPPTKSLKGAHGADRRAVMRSIWRAVTLDPRFAYKTVLCAAVGLRLGTRLRMSDTRLLHADFASAPATVAMVAGAIANIPFTFCGHAFDVFSSAPAGRATRYLLGEKLRHARAAFAENSRVLAVLTSCRPCGSSSAQLHLKRNAVALSAATRPRNPEPLLVGLGALVRKKGFDLLIRAVAELQQTLPALRAEIWGSGAEEAALRRLISKLRAPVELCGPYSHARLPLILDRASVVVIPSRTLQNGDSDGVPTVLMEAGNLGVPVIGSDVGAVSDLVQTGETGWLVPEENLPALKDAIREALTDPDKAARFAAAAKRRIAAEFSVERNVRVMQRVWADIIDDERLSDS